MPYQTIGGVVSVVLVVWHVFWRVGFVRELARRAGLWRASPRIKALRRGTAFGPSRALIAGAILGAVWSSTVVILHHVHPVFAGIFEATQG